VTIGVCISSLTTGFITGTCIKTGEAGRDRDTGTGTTGGGKEEITGAGIMIAAGMIATEATTGDMTEITVIADMADDGKQGNNFPGASMFFLMVLEGKI
jgi:hypothetical protein